MKHLLGIAELEKSEIDNILDRAEYYGKALAEGKWDRERLKNKIILTLFFEASTRTLTSTGGLVTDCMIVAVSAVKERSLKGFLRHFQSGQGIVSVTKVSADLWR